MFENKLKTLILVGGGHAHLYLIKQMISDKLQGYRTVLISSESEQYYSGMASGYIEGTYTEKDFTVDLPRLCSKSDVVFIKDTLILINPATKILETASGKIYKNDYLQNIEFPYILGAGDCIAFKNYDYVKKVGVYAIRE